MLPDRPPASAYESEGGRLMTQYLDGKVTGKAVVDAVFNKESEAVNRLAEMSFAVHRRHLDGTYSDADQEKVQVLEMALDKRLTETVRYHETIGDAIKYGTTITAGAIGFIFAPEISSGVNSLFRSSAVQTPKNIATRMYTGASNFANKMYTGATSIFKRGPTSGSAASDITGEAAADAGEATSASEGSAVVAANEAAAAAEHSAAAAAHAAVAAKSSATAAETVGELNKPAGLAGKVKGRGRPATDADTKPASSDTATLPVLGTVAESAAASESVQNENLSRAAEDLAQSSGSTASAKAAAADAAAVGDGASAESAAAAKAASAKNASADGRDWYSRAIAGIKTRNGRLTSEELIVRDVSYALSSPDLAKGFEVVAVPESELDTVKFLQYSKTGRAGFQVNQAPGNTYFTARTLAPLKGWDYFYVRGRAIEVMTDDGRKVVIPGGTVVNLASARLKSFNSADMFAMSDSSNRLIKRTAIGGTAGLLTLWGMSTVDTKYLTVNEYVSTLAKSGINLYDFPDQLRSNWEEHANVPRTSPKTVE
jgi:hypothetical protein